MGIKKGVVGHTAFRRRADFFSEDIFSKKSILVSNNMVEIIVKTIRSAKFGGVENALNTF